MEFKNADTFEKQINELNNLSLEYQNDQKTFQKKYGNEINEFIENEIIDQIIPDAFDI
ncbi:hypothetical protein B808_479 [Fructilactobacillus florum 8D]|uniref:Uncharacterized protein n=3 Tax=Fructilactobacillus florum TaxID=640331 RepID=W9EEM6_9LACO|nr:hypothetical protein B807_40 [Fructilactobacillus florum 2F]ETO40578.1 hypothetical protein B808_479 [Fructilactobacillus florum 8D]KRM89706.1 hypothetical protein FC87_GL000346 [Fructilactobacillus florum DSM 22689 = JCM 16035]